MAKAIQAADLFAGAGGTSTALAQACDELGRRLRLTAVNHWPVAVETHAANHPEAEHLCESLDGVDPRKAIRGRLDVLCASPECTHHSNARGGKPCSDQSRSTAWHVVRWAEALRPRAILVENVREFLGWGPLGSNGRPLKSRKGDLFAAWAQALEACGYRVGWRLVNAADFGGATSRTRLFVVAVRGRGPLPWAEPTHERAPEAGLFGALKPWRAAREVIDWSLPGKSIFGRKTPLAENTLRRIAEGIRRFWGVDPEPFITAYHNGPDGDRRNHSIDGPLPTLDTSNRYGLVSPFLVPTNFGEREGQRPRTHDVGAPLPTLVGSGSHALVEPFLVNYYSTGGPHSLDAPLPTLTARDRFGLVTPSGAVVSDVLFRMLQPHELAAGMGFPAGYRFVGTREQVVKQIGNAVEVNKARSHLHAMLRAIAA